MRQTHERMGGPLDPPRQRVVNLSQRLRSSTSSLESAPRGASFWTFFTAFSIKFPEGDRRLSCVAIFLASRYAFACLSLESFDNSVADRYVRVTSALVSVVLRLLAMSTLLVTREWCLSKYSAALFCDHPCFSVRSFTLSASSRTGSRFPWVVFGTWSICS